MKTNSIYFAKYFILLIFITIGCSKNKEKTEYDNVIALEVDVKKDHLFDISDCATISNIVPLETTEHSLIKNIDKIYITDLNFVVFDKTRSVILLFRNDGSFVHQIGNRGQGPDEYLEFNDIYFDEKEELIYAHDGVNRYMHIYDLNGKLLDKKYTKHWFNSFCVTEKGYWVYSCFNSDENNPNGYALKLLDKKDLNKVITGHLPQNRFYPSTHETRFFKDSNDSLLFIYPFSDFAYLLDGTDVTPYYKFDFKEKNLPYADIRKSKDADYLEQLEKDEKYFGNMTNIVFSKRSIYFTFTDFTRESLTYFSMYDRQAKQTNVYGGFKPFKGIVFDDIVLKSLVFTHPIYSYKEEVVFKIDVDYLFDEDLSYLKKKIKSVGLDSNPILFFVRINQR